MDVNQVESEKINIEQAREVIDAGQENFGGTHAFQQNNTNVQVVEKDESPQKEVKISDQEYQDSEEEEQTPNKDNDSESPPHSSQKKNSRYRSQMDIESKQDTMTSKRNNKSKSSTKKDMMDDKRKNQFWKFRHKPGNNQKREIILEEEPPVHKLHFNHINLQNQEEVMKVSILKAMDYNDKLIQQRAQMQEILRQQERQNQRTVIENTKQSKFPTDIPLLCFDRSGNKYISDPNPVKENKATIEQFIHLNVQHEHNLMYINELGRSGIYLSRGQLKNKKRRKRKKF